MLRWVSAIGAVVIVGLLGAGCSKTSNDDSGDSGELPPPSFQAFLLDWYAEYDAEESLSYLDEEGSLETLTFEGTDYQVLRDAHYGPHGERTSMDVFLPPAGPSASPVVCLLYTSPSPRDA